MVLTFEEALQSIHEALGEIHTFASHASVGLYFKKKNKNLLCSECQFTLSDNFSTELFLHNGSKKSLWGFCLFVFFCVGFFFLLLSLFI